MITERPAIRTRVACEPLLLMRNAYSHDNTHLISADTRLTDSSLHIGGEVVT